MQDPFVGTWKLNPAKSEFDQNHRPRGGTMIFELSSAGHYVLKAEGLGQNGEKVTERPVEFILDGKSHPLAGLPGLSFVATRTATNTITGEVRAEGGSVVDGGTDEVSPDGKSLVARTFGRDSQSREFKQHSVWDLQECAVPQVRRFP